MVDKSNPNLLLQMDNPTQAATSDPKPDLKGTEEQGPDARARRREQVRRAQRYVPPSNQALVGDRMD